MEEKITTRRKSVKATLLEMKEGDTIKLPRKRYSTLSATKSIAKIENPERDWTIRVVADGIEVTCLK
mgnify:CR=1 FL=1|jgi:hypothetical protein